MVAKALKAEGIPTEAQSAPMRWSEDFGQFGRHCPSTLFVLGSGKEQPQLHNPDFDFPDSLTPVGAPHLRAYHPRSVGLMAIRAAKQEDAAALAALCIEVWLHTYCRPGIPPVFASYALETFTPGQYGRADFRPESAFDG